MLYLQETSWNMDAGRGQGFQDSRYTACDFSQFFRGTNNSARCEYFFLSIDGIWAETCMLFSLATKGRLIRRSSGLGPHWSDSSRWKEVSNVIQEELLERECSFLLLIQSKSIEHEPLNYVYAEFQRPIHCLACRIVCLLRGSKKHKAQRKCQKV